MTAMYAGKKDWLEVMPGSLAVTSSSDDKPAGHLAHKTAKRIHYNTVNIH